MSNFFQAAIRKLKTWSDIPRREHAIKLEPRIPVRIHAPNGGYLFSVYADESGIYRFNDKRWGDKRHIPARRVTWEEPI